MKSMNNLIGQTLEEARSSLSAQKELKYRIVKTDGKGMIITCDFNPDRLNLEVENGIITNVYEG